jgi:hypothetical protein
MFLTTKHPARRSRNRNSDYLPQRRKGRKVRKITVKQFLQNNPSLPSELGVLCALAGINPLSSNIPDTGKFARAAQTLRYSSTKGTKDSDLFDKNILNFVIFVAFVVNNILSC